MTDALDIAAHLSEGLVIELAWAGPDVTLAVLEAAAVTPYRGDVHTYLADVQPVIAAAFTQAMQPQMNAARAEAAAAHAELLQLEVAFADQQRRFEEFRRMKTPDTVQ